jgi:hypothetical protein
MYTTPERLNMADVAVPEVSSATDSIRITPPESAVTKDDRTTSAAMATAALTGMKAKWTGTPARLMMLRYSYEARSAATRMSTPK